MADKEKPQAAAKAQAEKNTAEPQKEKATKKDLVAAVRVRGGIRVKSEIVSTIEMLRLHKKNSCVVYEKTPSIMGMIKKAKDYITWGEIDDETYKMLVVKRGKPLKEDKDSIKPYFCLNPPVKGFGRKGVKTPFVMGGALGNRGSKINDLIKRML